MNLFGGAGASPSEDIQLMLEVARGNADAFERLYARLSVPLLNLVCSIVRSRTAAEDVRQEVFREIWSRAGDYRPNLGTPFSWVMTIARHKAIDRLRWEVRQLRQVAEYEADFEMLGNGREPPADFCAMIAEDGAAVEDAIARLRAEERQAIELSFFDGLSSGEIARRLSIPVGTIKGRVRRALRHLRPFLAPWR